MRDDFLAGLAALERASLRQNRKPFAQATAAQQEALLRHFATLPKASGEAHFYDTLVSLTADDVERKLDLLEKHFQTQSGRHWFDRDTFRGLMRLRGMEAVAPERFAEAFTARKVALAS